MSNGSIARLASAVGYPERIPEEVLSYPLRVDGAELMAEESEGRIRLACALAGEDEFLRPLAEYAVGRMLKEDAILSYGRLPGSESPSKVVFLWQDAPDEASRRELVRLFETFADSCDWWRERVEALRDGAAAASEPDTMMIRP